MPWKCGSARKRRMRTLLRELYGDNCHWCGQPMIFGASNDPFGASIEHLVPCAEGGTNKQSNLRLAHKRCNEDRSYPTPKRARELADVSA